MTKKKVIRISIIAMLSLIIVAFLVVVIVKSTLKKELFYAVENNDYEAVEKLLSYGANVNSRRFIINSVAFANVVEKNDTPLIIACRNGNEDIIKLLVENGADVNLEDNYTNQTPLLQVLSGVEKNRFSLAMYLIKNGADIHAVREKYTSVFQETLYISSTDDEETIQQGFELFKYLMSQNVDMKVYMGKGNALTHSATFGNYNVVKYLVENEYFDVNSVSDAGNTALICAAKGNEKEIVELLLELNADKSMKDNDGKTAYDHAVELGHTDIAELLRGDTEPSPVSPLSWI